MSVPEWSEPGAELPEARLSIPERFEAGGEVPELLFGYVSVNSKGGVAAIDAEPPALADAEPFRATSEDQGQAESALESVGLEVVAESRLGRAVAGPPGAFEELTGGEVVKREVLLHAESGRERYVTHVDIIGDDQPEAVGVARAASGAAKIEAVLIERPRIPQAIFPSPIPPRVPKFHVHVPDDVSLLLGAIPAHRQGHLGEGVTVAMVDSGQAPHPFFLAHSYDVQPAVSLVEELSPAHDPVGHGTGESANIFAVAPACTLRPYRASDDEGRLVSAMAAFMRAKGANPRPHVLTNSWGGDVRYPPTGPPDQWDTAWGLEIRDAVEQGIVVVFSAGNGSFTIEPQVPGVVAAGGVYLNPALELQASNYASGYKSPWFEDVTVPTVCGLVGTLPRAQYLMLPVPPGCQIDMRQSAAVPDDPPDGTTDNDGWALFSGTSAAAPQIAGAVALILGARPGLSPAQVRQALVESATDVRTGRCHPRFNSAAGVDHDEATGAGLANAAGAVSRALERWPPPDTEAGEENREKIIGGPWMDRVETIRPSATVRQAAERLAQATGPLAVVKANKLVGVLSARDIVKEVVAKGRDPASVKVNEVATKDVVTAWSSEGLEVAVSKLVNHVLDRLVVIKTGKKPAGTISATRVLFAWRRYSGERVAPPTEPEVKSS
jgi:subtilisin family serine protease